MFRHLFSMMLGCLLITFAVISHPEPVQAQSEFNSLAKAIQEIENLDAMRSGLASYLKDAPEPPTAETMKQVCKPVGIKAKQLSQENGWQVKQLAKKYRNLTHQADTPQAKIALDTFEQTPNLMGFWEHETLEGQTGIRYYRRINVEASCLACHGSKDQRPPFVKEKYPQDLAYDFKVGDLRGMYAVFIPDSVQQSVQAALNDSTQL